MSQEAPMATNEVAEQPAAGSQECGSDASNGSDAADGSEATTDAVRSTPHHTHNGAAHTASPSDAASRPAAKPSFGASPTALQDVFLNGLRRENIDVVVYFCDGSQERGTVRAFDTFTVLLENRNSGKAQLLYKHAIARIFPTRTPSQLFGERGGKK